MFFGVSIKGPIVENVSHISYCARDTHFKHFTLFLTTAILITVRKCSCEEPGVDGTGSFLSRTQWELCCLFH